MELVFFFAMDFAAIYQSVCLSKWNLNTYIPPNISFRHLFAAWVRKIILNSLIIILVAHQNRQLAGLLDLRK